MSTDIGSRSGSRRARDEEVDVVIVGAGPSGSVAALHLARAGMSVVALEQGDWPDYGDYTGARPEHELVSTKVWHPNPNVRDNPVDYPVDTSESDINPLMFAGVGGSATLYGAQWMHFVPSDFRVRSLDGVGEDWPSPTSSFCPTSSASSARSASPGFPAIRLFPRVPLIPSRRCRWARSAGAARLVRSAWAGIGGQAATPSRR